MFRKFSAFLALSFLLGAAGLLAESEIRFELGFGWTMVGPQMDSTYVNRYKPPLTPPDRYIDSSAEQTVRFKGKTTYGLNGFFNLLFTENLGLQLLFDYHRPGLGGTNTPYTGEVQYLGTGDIVETFSRSLEWDNSAGNLTQTTFSLNALARFRIADNLSLSVSAGPSMFNYEGKAGYIGYTFFDLIENALGDYILSGMTYHMVVDFGPQTNYGMNVGVEAAFEAFRQVILAFDLRWFGAAAVDLPLHVVEDEVITVPIEEIESTIGLGSLSINPSYFRAGLAIRFIF